MLVVLRALILLLFSLPASQVVTAHPHVWITAKADLVFDKDNNFVAIRHQWEFDEAFAAYATRGLDTNRDGKYTRKELAKLAKINVESIADFYYFTFVKMGDVEPDFDAAEDYWLEYENGLLTLFYTLPLAEPVQPHPARAFEDLTIEIFDPMFFAAVNFARHDPVTIDGIQISQTGCIASVAQPKELDPLQAQLIANVGPAEDIPDDIAPGIDYLANTISLSCLPL